MTTARGVAVLTAARTPTIWKERPGGGSGDSAPSTGAKPKHWIQAKRA